MTRAIGAVRQRVNKRHQVGELLGVETLRAEEEFFGARTALRGHVGVAAVPFERLGTGQVFERAIVDDVLAEAIGLQIPLQAVDGGVEMTVRAAELSLKGEVGGVEEALAAAQGIYISGSAEVNRGDDFIFSCVNDGKIIVKAIGHV